MSQFHISTDTDEFDVPLVHRFLSEDSYWARGMALSAVRKGMDNSLCFGGFLGSAQVAFGRAVTDYATFAYLRDFFVLPEFRGRGYGRALVQAAMARLQTEGVGRVMLGTTDAHGLYEKFGFKLIGNSPNLMVAHPQASARPPASPLEIKTQPPGPSQKPVGLANR